MSSGFQISNKSFLVTIIGLIIISNIACSKDNSKGPAFTYDPIKLEKDTSFLKGLLSTPIIGGNFDEASGIVASKKYPGYFYVNNDGGNPADLYMIDSLGGIVGRIDLKGINNRDWEDITLGPGPVPGKLYVYIADIGDNQAIHSTYLIYRFEEPDLMPSVINPFDKNIDNIDKFSFSYSDNTSHNAEAIMIEPDSKNIYLVTKAKYSEIYCLKLIEDQNVTQTAQFLFALPIAEVNAGDISASKQILLKDYTRVYIWNNPDQLPVDSIIKTVPKESSYTIEPQGESICWAVDEKSYYTISEVAPGINQYLIRYKKKK